MSGVHTYIMIDAFINRVFISVNKLRKLYKKNSSCDELSQSKKDSQISQICPVCFTESEEDKNIIFIIHSCKHVICEECFVKWHIQEKNPNCVICRQTILTIPKRRVRNITMHNRRRGQLSTRCGLLFFFIILILLSIKLFFKRKEVLTIMLIICITGILFSLISLDNYCINRNFETNNLEIV